MGLESHESPLVPRVYSRPLPASRGQQWKEPLIASRSSTNLKGSSGSQELIENPRACKGLTSGLGHSPYRATPLPVFCTLTLAPSCDSKGQLLLCPLKSLWTYPQWYSHLNDQGQYSLKISGYCPAFMVIHTTTKEC